MKRFGIHQGVGEFKNWLSRLFRKPIFIFVTLWGHSAILAGAFAFHYFEGAAKGHTFFDSYYWAISIATTIGSDYTPHTLGGKIVGIAMMVLGSLFYGPILPFSLPVS